MPVSSYLRTYGCSSQAVWKLHPVAPGETTRMRCLRCDLPFGTGTDPNPDQSCFDIGGDFIGMILLQVMQTRTQLHHSAILEALRKALSVGG
jgi:hypothetical protein